jgi:photosystem II stability/assembly factor-like uncharacterized protein
MRTRLIRLALPLMAFFYLGPTLWSQGQAGGAVEPVRMINASKDPLLAGFRFRSIGPASMGGRIDDIAVYEPDPSIIYLGYATAGVWKSVNAGTTFEPIFDEYTTASIGDLAIHPSNPDVLYVGTGEPNNRQSSSFGDGIYKTTDGGKTFLHIGLRETQTIARIVIDPRNPDTVYVAAVGHLFGPNKERGVYKTTDGGKTWTNVKFIDEHTGFTDLAMDPSNSNILYAASYQRRRSGCCFNGGGPGSGIWKTTDGGKNWTRIVGNGLPPGTYGRIALDVSRSNPNVVYAQVDAGQENQPMPQRGAGRGGRGGGGGYDWCNNAGPNKGFGRGGRGQEPEQPDEPRTPPALDPSRGGIFRSDNKGAGWLHVSNCNARPMYFSQIRVDPSNDQVVYVAGLPVAKSLDGGKSFATLNDAGGYGSPGHVDQHAIWIDPRNPKHLVIGNDGGLNISWDQGKTWDFVDTMATAQSYWVSADMRRPYYVYTGLQDNGSWGGPSAIRNNEGILNSDWFRIGGGDGFQTAVDPTDYNIVYSESQNGNTNRSDLRKPGSVNIRPRAPGGGRGTPPSGPEATEGAQAGRPPAQQAQQPAQQTAQQPAPPPQQQQGGGGRGGPPNVLNARPGDQYRFNWNTPFALSPHDPSTIWLGGNRLFRSTNRGDTWVASEDLTKQVDRSQIPMMGVPGDRTMLSKNDGVSNYSTIISLSESPVLPGVVWVGTDDGNVQVSRDGGATFTEVGSNMAGLPPNHRHWISRIEASHVDPASAYVSIDGHRDDDLKPYLYVTRDYGKTWQSVAGDLPQFGNIQVVREDPRNRDLLYVGTEFGLYLSMNGGKNWQKFMNNLPTARVDDILVHPRDNDLIVATHARGVWILDDITPLQQMTPAMAARDVVLFDVRPAVAYINDRQSGQYVGGQKHFIGENPPRGASINYYLKAAAAGDVRVTVADLAGRELRTIDGTKHAGINRVMWNLTEAPPEGQRGGRGGGRGGGGGRPVEPGTYVVTLEVDGQRHSQSVTVLEDVWLSQR